MAINYFPVDAIIIFSAGGGVSAHRNRTVRRLVECVSSTQMHPLAQQADGTDDAWCRVIDRSAIEPFTKKISADKSVRSSAVDGISLLPVCGGEVLFACTTGRPLVVVMPPACDAYAVSNDFMVLRPKPDIVDTRYLYHMLQCSDFVAQLAGLPKINTTLFDLQIALTMRQFPELAAQLIGLIKTWLDLHGEERDVAWENAFLELTLAFPDLPEQRRVADLLDRQEELCVANFQDVAGNLQTVFGLYSDMANRARQ